MERTGITLKQGTSRAQKCNREKQAYLGDEVTSESNITGSCMGHIVGDEVNVSLNLMQHSISVGHAMPVLHAGAPVSANHTVDLCLDFGCFNTVGNDRRASNAFL